MAMTGLARQIALPHEFSPQRFPSFPALDRTATMGFSVPTTLSVPASTAVKIGLSRQAAYPMWADQSFASLGYSVSYVTEQLVASAGSLLDVKGAIVNMNSAVSGNTTAGNYQIGLSGSTGDLKYVPLGMDSATGPLPFVYVPAGMSLSVIAGLGGQMPNSTQATVIFDRWVAPGETVPSSAGPAAISTTNYSTRVTNDSSSSTSMWIRPREVIFQHSSTGVFNFYGVVSIVVGAGTQGFTPSSSTQGLITLTASPRVAFLPLVFPVEFANSKLPWFSTRTTAAAVLVTNVTQIQKKGGTVLAGRLAPAVVDMWSAQQSDITNLHPAEKAFLALETGYYSFCPPSTDLAAFWDYTSIGPAATGFVSTLSQPSSIPLYRLDNDSLVNVAYLTAGPDAETFAVTCDWHIEFRTSSALFQIGLSTLTIESLHQAQLTLAAVGYFFENVNHKQILSAVTSAAKRYGPALLAAVPHPAAKMASAMILSSKPKPSPNTTSAAASGYMPRTAAPKSKGKKGKPGKSKRNK